MVSKQAPKLYRGAGCEKALMKVGPVGNTYPKGGRLFLLRSGWLMLLLLLHLKLETRTGLWPQGRRMPRTQVLGCTPLL